MMKKSFLKKRLLHVLLMMKKSGKKVPVAECLRFLQKKVLKKEESCSVRKLMKIFPLNSAGRTALKDLEDSVVQNIYRHGRKTVLVNVRNFL